MLGNARAIGLVGSLTAGAFLLATSGCATMVHGTQQRITPELSPPGTHVSIYRWTGELVAEGTSPDPITISRPVFDQPYLVKMTRDGYCPRYDMTQNGVTVTGTINTILLLATFPTIIWLLPTVIDMRTGASYNVNEEPTFRGSLQEVSTCPQS